MVGESRECFLEAKFPFQSRRTSFCTNIDSSLILKLMKHDSRRIEAAVGHAQGRQDDFNSPENLEAQ